VSHRIPRATYRVQLNGEFTFCDAARAVPYLAALGISHLYASPILKARPGSPHGYDVTDHGQLNPELGTIEDFDGLMRALRAHSMGLLLDIVPNHLGVMGNDNLLWLDVLENGPAAKAAGWFDIDWHPNRLSMRNRMLVPVLGDPYGQALERGEIRVVFDALHGEFSLRYHQHRFPIDPREYPMIFAGRQLDNTGDAATADFESLMNSFTRLPPREAVTEESRDERYRDKEAHKRRLVRLIEREPQILAHIDAVVAAFNGTPGEPHSFDALDALHQAQAYRLSYWRVASDEINYRRFFDVNDLAALRMDDLEVFSQTHELIGSLIARGAIDGLRIDHSDGLYDPQRYFLRLRKCLPKPEAACAGEGGSRGDEAGEMPSDERPRTVRDKDPSGESSSDRSAGARTLESSIDTSAGVPAEEFPRDTSVSIETDELPKNTSTAISARAFPNEAPAAIPAQKFPNEAPAEAPPLYVVTEKILAQHERLPESWAVQGTTGYEFSALATGWLIHDANEKAFTRIYRAFTGEASTFEAVAYEARKLIMRISLAPEIEALATQLDRIAQLDRHTADFTRAALRNAIIEVLAFFPVYRTYVTGRGVSEEDRRTVDWAVALARKRSFESDVSVYDFLREALLAGTGLAGQPRQCEDLLEFSMKFQQVSAPVAAKGVEDTALYRYNRLLCLNEVGADPRRFGVSTQALHQENAHRARHWPHSLLATSTHDSKRSEDVRARIAVLSELPEQWRRKLSRWSRLNRGKRAIVQGQPVPDRNDEYMIYQTLLGMWSADEDPGIRQERLRVYMIKASREAKRRTSWLNPDAEYEQALSDFVERLLRPATPRRESQVPESRKPGSARSHVQSADSASAAITSWEAVFQGVESLGRPSPARISSGRNAFLEDFEPLWQVIDYFGRLNALAQVILKLTAPGVPDLYQGCESWMFALVDPDNRRRLDVDAVAQHLALLRARQGRAKPGPQDELRGEFGGESRYESQDESLSKPWGASWGESRGEFLGGLLAGLGRPGDDAKLFVTQSLLGLRAETEAVFREGAYLPLPVAGERAAHLLAFARLHAGDAVMVMVSRWACTLMCGRMTPPLDNVWSDTRIELPAEFPAGAYSDVFGGENIEVSTTHSQDGKMQDDAMQDKAAQSNMAQAKVMQGRVIEVAKVFSAFPFAVFRRVSRG